MNNEKKTLVILSPGFPESEADSTCLPMQQYFIRSLKKNYPSLNIIILSFQYPYFKKTYSWFDNTVISFSGKNKGGWRRFVLRRKLDTTLENIHRTTKITGLLSFWYGECALVGKRFARKHGLNHYCWVLGQDAKKENKYPALIPPRAEELIALSDSLQDEFEKNHSVRPQHIIPSGIDTEHYGIPVTEKDVHMLAAGSLIPLKQYDLLPSIVSEIEKRIPDLKVIITGDGPERKKLETLIQKEGLETTITLTGELPHYEVLKLMQRAKLFLHPSSYEGFSSVCLEALYNRAHVISFCRAMKQPIEQWHIVADKEEMTKKSLQLLQDNHTEYSTIFVFSIDESVHKMMALF